MEPILKIYQKYQIMPQLERHMLSVAAVGSFICDNFLGNLPKADIVSACLLHDMGNIVKFDFNFTRKFLKNAIGRKNLAFWISVQKAVKKKYGGDSHKATAAIIKELGASKKIQKLADCVGFNQGQANAKSSDFARKICAYSDMRVEPMGVVSLEERFLGLRQRYKKHKEGEKHRHIFEIALRKIEKQIFARCFICPEDITPSAVKKYARELKNFVIIRTYAPASFFPPLTGGARGG